MRSMSHMAQVVPVEIAAVGQQRAGHGRLMGLEGG